MAAMRYWVWLSSLRGLQNHSKLVLLHHFGSPEEIYFAGAEDYAQVEGLNRGQIDLLADKSLRLAEEILQQCAQKDIFLITMDDALYPYRLKNIFDPPILLYGRGKMPLFDDEVAVAVVGTRSATPYGIDCGEKLGYELSKQGGMVVSGMARGIDAAALRGALRAGGFPCAVLGGGVDVIYPAENRRLYEDILAKGVLLSEYPPCTQPEGWHFPERNRIMSALSVGTLVIEAGERSGALITATNALEQGREVFAVPGPIDAPQSAGCHRLIREGAILVGCAWDLLQEYESRYPGKLRRKAAAAPEMPMLSGEPAANDAQTVGREEKKAPKRRAIRGMAEGLTDDQIRVLQLLDADTAMLTDEVAERTGIPMRRVLSALTMLEIDGYAEKTGTQSFVRTVDIITGEE